MCLNLMPSLFSWYSPPELICCQIKRVSTTTTNNDRFILPILGSLRCRSQRCFPAAHPGARAMLVPEDLLQGRHHGLYAHDPAAISEAHHRGTSNQVRPLASMLARRWMSTSVSRSS